MPEYFNGDEIKPTGHVTADGFEEFVYVDGHRKGELGYRMAKGERAKLLAERAAAYRADQADFRRLHK